MEISKPKTDLHVLYSATRRGIEHANSWLNLSGPALGLSATLGAVGLAVGVPYMPGLTDNIALALVGAVVPLLNGQKVISLRTFIPIIFPLPFLFTFSISLLRSILHKRKLFVLFVFCSLLPLSSCLHLLAAASRALCGAGNDHWQKPEYTVSRAVRNMGADCPRCPKKCCQVYQNIGERICATPWVHLIPFRNNLVPSFPCLI